MRAKCLFRDAKGAAQQRFSTRVVASKAQNQGQTIQMLGDFDVFGSQFSFGNLQSPPVTCLSAGIVTLPFQYPAEVAQANGRIRMFGTEGFLEDGECPAGLRLSGVEVALVAEDAGEVVGATRRVRVFGPERFLADREPRTYVKFGGNEIAFDVKKRSEIVVDFGRCRGVPIPASAREREEPLGIAFRPLRTSLRSSARAPIRSSHDWWCDGQAPIALGIRPVPGDRAFRISHNLLAKTATTPDSAEPMPAASQTTRTRRSPVMPVGRVVRRLHNRL